MPKRSRRSANLRVKSLMLPMNTCGESSDLLDGQLGACLFTDAVGAAARRGARIAGDDRRPAGGVGVELQFAEASPAASRIHLIFSSVAAAVRLRASTRGGRLDGQIASSDPHALVPHPGRAIDESAWQL